MNTSGIGLTEETFSSISDLISQNNVRLLNKKLDIYDLVSLYLEGNQSEDPFFIVNIGDVIKQYEKWIAHLPNVKPFYAIKCNPDPLIMKVLHRLGCGFDCASKNEILKVLDLGASPDDIIFANPCKMSNMIKFARAHDVDTLTLDSEHELYKIKLYHSNAKLVVRIITDDKDSICKFSCKFGADLTEAESIIKIAKELNLNIVGVSFHVGSGCGDPKAFGQAISDARKVFDMGKKAGYEMSLLDIGGGFPGRDDDRVSFEDIANNVKEAIEKHFADWKEPELNIIAEPGRFFVSKSHTLVSSVMNKKYKKDPVTGEKKIIYYINDGVYSSFFNIPMDHFVINEKNTFPFNERHEKKFKSKIFGPTCDSIDMVVDDIMMPDLEVGEYIIHTDMGAYTLAVNTGNEVFNGFDKTRVNYFIN
jgi:ornithine decarboxylase